MTSSCVNFLVKIPIRCWDINGRGLLLFAAPCILWVNYLCYVNVN